ncbi:glycosyltransferase family 4 protein [Notoacmeibacter marinus]|uniref:glycosyltransferase family 4 protein n=1 Tax=Notoacmeibacter marinus TaxID=1876515 RepID=UPI000DF35CEE|nr:glycosyltransferase family 4 protein [Notoacmeibacter marinus]
MKIAQVAPLWFPVPPIDHGGTERVVHDLTNALVDLGHEVTLFAADGSKTNARLIPQGPAIASIPDAPPSMPSAAECVMLDRAAAMADAFDIIHCHTELYHAAVLHPYRHKLCMTIHWRADEADRKAYFSHFDDLAVIAISKSQQGQLPPSNRAGLVHHGIPGNRLAFEPSEEGRLAFLGRMTDQKRPDRAIAIAQAAGLPLDLAGTVDVGNPSYFESHVTPHLSETIRYVGPVNETGKQALLGGATALLFPIDWPEPFGLVMIEAMACGTPVIAWRNGAAPEIVEDGVTGFVVETVDEAVEAVRKARQLDRATIRKRFEERFTAPVMAENYLAAYRRLIEGSARSAGS